MGDVYPIINFERSTKLVSNGNDGGDGMEPRIAKLESDVAHIKDDISGIKSDIREMRADIKRVEAKFEAKFDKIDAKFDIMNGRLFAGLCAMVGCFLTVAGAIIALVLK
ncbi:MAG: hypothetical protein LBV04_05910 [Deferribacteraceae bacterium]|jgi:uncharacterized coiled-coil protein SlyX|nr:hypothetical protein [Deferribacteraceae bacterium]